jgi:DNA-binding MarR family transcriptional regulator
MYIMKNNLDHSRLLNLFGALSLHVSDCIKDVTEDAAGFGGSIPASLIQINSFCEGSFEKLQRSLGTTQSATTKVVQKMNQNDLLELKKSAVDKRVVELFLSEKGKTIYSNVVEARKEVLSGLVSCLEEDEKQTLLNIVEKLLTHSISDRESSDHVCRLCDLNSCPQNICPAEIDAPCRRVNATL